LLAQDSELFAKTMIGVIPRIAPCFRIHVSGDFHTAEYIKAWTQICREFLQLGFWSYTRSWTEQALFPYLEELRDLPNVQLFASTDATMPLPPKGWRIAFIDKDSRAEGLECKHQSGLKESCLECGYCYEATEGHVIFKMH